MKKLLIVGAVLALLAGIAFGAWRFVQGREAEAYKPNLSAIQTALNSRDLRTQAAVMDPELAAAYLRAGNNMLPPGTAIKLQPETLRVNGEFAEVGVLLPAGKDSWHATFLLIRQNGAWKLLTTEGK